MIIKWIAHSCFKVTLENGIVMVFDPFENIGYDMPEIKADIVFVSHSHYDHSAVHALTGDFTLFDKVGVYEKDGIQIEGIASFHDDNEGKDRGANIIFKVKAEGVTLVHFGDLGHMPDESAIEKVKSADVVMVPIGGNYTLDAEEAFALTKKLQPNMIIPMHYKTPGLTVDIAPLYPYIEAITGYYDRAMQGKSEITFTKDDKKKRTRVMILEPSAEVPLL